MWQLQKVQLISKTSVCTHAHISCTVLSVELLLIWNPNCDGSASTFIDIWNVNAVDVCVYPLLGLTESKKKLHCWQSMFKTQLLMMAVEVEDSAFTVDSRCRRPTFRCQQSMSKTYLSMSAVDVEDLPFVVSSRCLLQCCNSPSLCTVNSQHIHTNTQNITLQMSISITILTVYCYRFKLLSFSTEMKDGSKQN
jgi:hypothetical protein